MKKNKMTRADKMLSLIDKDLTNISTIKFTDFLFTAIGSCENGLTKHIESHDDSESSTIARRLIDLFIGNSERIKLKNEKNTTILSSLYTDGLTYNYCDELRSFSFFWHGLYIGTAELKRLNINMLIENEVKFMVKDEEQLFSYNLVFILNDEDTFSDFGIPYL